MLDDYVNEYKDFIFMMKNQTFATNIKRVWDTNGSVPVILFHLKFGIFLHKTEEYVMEPNRCLYGGSTDKRYKISKLKRKPVSDADSIKSGTF